MNKFSQLTPDEKIEVLASLVNSLYSRVRELQIDIEFDKGVYESYGTTEMNNNDRLINRLMADLVMSDNGIPDHDTQARQWLKDTLWRKEHQRGTIT